LISDMPNKDRLEVGAHPTPLLRLAGASR
jgi:hypothetical protein